MKFSGKLSMAFAAMTLLAACSADEPANNGVDDKKPVGDVAYMTINISDVNNLRPAPQRAPSTADDFELGSDYEHKVTSARFFFYDNAGNYVMTASMGNPSFGTPGDNENNNIEYIGTENILVLEGLTSTGYPRFMVTVLNAPDFVCPETNITDAATALQQYATAFPDKQSNGTFVMSTSSYLSADDLNHDDTFYYATKLRDEDFYLSAEEALTNGNAVKVYVERLAAKVTLNISENAPQTTYTDAEGVEHVIYKLDQSLAGAGNGDENDEDKAVTDLYVEVEGWALNATNPQSYLCKQFDGWSESDLWADWNESKRHRSYWAKSSVYGDAALNADPVNNTGYPLNYSLVSNLSRALGEVEYCYENTNSTDMILEASKTETGKMLVKPARVTHVALKARVCDANGASIDMVRYNGLLFKTEAYKNYLLNQLKSKGELNFYTYDAAANEYTQVGTAALALESDGTGKMGQVVVVPAEGLKLYYRTGDKDENGNNVYGEVDAPEYTGKTFAATIASVQNAEHPAVNFNDGASVYYIPVEHQTYEVDNTAEGYYGVVRNHAYRLTVSKFSKVGHGVFDPDNETVTPDEPEDPLYYVGVNISVLSWRIVNQDNIVL